MYQEQYWKELFQLKAHINFVEACLRESEGTERNINIFLAITSSSSICAWAIWQEASWLWAGIIALSQLISAVKAYLPYKARITAYSGLLHELEEIILYAEKLWYDVSEGKLTNEEINNLRFDIKTRKIKSLKKHFPTSSIPENQSLFEAATKQAEVHFLNFYKI